MKLFCQVLIIFLELIGFSITFRAERFRIFIYYTEISNFLALVSVILSLCGFVYAPVFRYTACAMLLMTFLISLFVLAPSCGGLKALMFDGNSLYHHTLVPIISLLSYVLFEEHSSLWLVPVAVSLFYGFVMFQLNYKNMADGPYPFFRVHEQGKKKSLLWVLILFLVIASVSLGIVFLAP